MKMKNPNYISTMFFFLDKKMHGVLTASPVILKSSITINILLKKHWKLERHHDTEFLLLGNLGERSERPTF